MNILKIFKNAPMEAKENPLLPPVDPIAAVGENAPSADAIADKLRSEYVAPGDASQSTKKPRKPRSDLGKPRTPKNLGGDAAQNQNAPGAVPGANAGFTLDKQVVEKTALTVLHTIDGAVVRRVGRTCFALSKDEGLSAEMARDAGLTKEEGGLMAELTGVIFEKRGWLTGYAPEILLSLLLVEWSTRIALIMRRLDSMLKDKKEKEKRKNVDSPSPIENAGNG